MASLCRKPRKRFGRRHEPVAFTKARRILAALQRIGWSVKRDTGGSHRVLERVGWMDVVWAFHDGVEIGPAMLARVAKKTGLKPTDL